MALIFKLDKKRYYPEGTLAIDLILGLERFYKRQLSGQVGFKRNVIDATGSQLLTKNWQKVRLMVKMYLPVSIVKFNI